MSEKNDSGADAAAVDNSMATSADTVAPHVAPTPGPWRVSTEFGAFGDVVDSEGHYLAMAQPRRVDIGVTGQPVRTANAHLIAAAHELLEVVRLVAASSMSGSKSSPQESWIGWQWSQGGTETAHRIKELARAAIAKAEGGRDVGNGNQASMEPASSLRSEAPNES